MELHEATLIAGSAVAQLAPYCDKITVAGSIRRRKPQVKDIEIVCVPKEKAVGKDLFGEAEKQRDPGFIEGVNMWRKIRGEPTGRYTQRVIQGEEDGELIMLDLFMCVPDNFGLILAIRTGPAEYSQHTIVKASHREGMKIQGGMLTRNGEIVPCPDEETLYKRLRIPMLHPEERV